MFLMSYLKLKCTFFVQFFFKVVQKNIECYNAMNIDHTKLTDLNKYIDVNIITHYHLHGN